MTGWPGVVYVGVGDDRVPFQVLDAVITQPARSSDPLDSLDSYVFDITYRWSIDWPLVAADPIFLAYLFCARDDRHEHSPAGDCIPSWIELGDG